jgi:hypothetical protein
LLLQNGANSALTNKGGQTARQIALELAFYKIAEELDPDPAPSGTAR